MPKSNSIDKFVSFKDLLIGMTEKELQVRYKNTIFGFLWVIVNPVLQMLVIGFIFKFFVKDVIANYYLYLLIGLLIWNFFNLSLTKATPSIINERSLIKKAKFPREVIPVSIILSNLVHLTIAFIILIIPVFFTGSFSLYGLPGLVLGLILLITFTLGISLLTSSLNVRFRDINFFIQAVLILWFYATPIVYSINVVPYRLMWFWRVNPLTSIVQLFQSCLVSAPGPGPAMLLTNILVISVVTAAGVIVFQHQSKNFDDWV